MSKEKPRVSYQLPDPESRPVGETIPAIEPPSPFGLKRHLEGGMQTAETRAIDAQIKQLGRRWVSGHPARERRYEESGAKAYDAMIDRAGRGRPAHAKKPDAPKLKVRITSPTTIRSGKPADQRDVITDQDLEKFAYRYLRAVRRRSGPTIARLVGIDSGKKCTKDHLARWRLSNGTSPWKAAQSRWERQGRKNATQSEYDAEKDDPNERKQIDRPLNEDVGHIPQAPASLRKAGAK